MAGTLIDGSNFVKPSTLVPHARWTFVAGGVQGIGFSESRRHESQNLRKEIERISHQEARFESNLVFLEFLYDGIINTLEGLEDKRTFLFRKIMADERIPKGGLPRNLTAIWLFRNIFGIDWSVVI